MKGIFGRSRVFQFCFLRSLVPTLQKTNSVETLSILDSLFVSPNVHTFKHIIPWLQEKAGFRTFVLIFTFLPS